MIPAPRPRRGRRAGGAPPPPPTAAQVPPLPHPHTINPPLPSPTHLTSPSPTGARTRPSGEEPRGLTDPSTGGGGESAPSPQGVAVVGVAPSSRVGGVAEEWHKCPECGRGFGTSRALKVHRSYHVGRKRPQGGGVVLRAPPPPSSHASAPPSHAHSPPSHAPPFKFHYICAECGLGFVAPGALGAHRCEHGRRRRRRSPSPTPPPPRRQAPPPPPQQATPLPGPPSPAPFRCTECAGAFGLVAELHEHYMLHARGEL